MKVKLLFLAIAICMGTNLHAQQRSVFRSGYLRLGINKLGNELDYGLSPKENIFDGRYGASSGYVLEFGHIYYFKRGENLGLVNYGLDWTILSLNYNKMDKWDGYAMASGAPYAGLEGEQIAGAVSSKIGPTVSLNLIEKLVVDLRFQIAPTFRFFDFGYSDDQVNGEGRYFSFTNYAQSDVDEDFDPESVKNRIAFGVGTGVGITVRRKALGLSLDYISGKVKSNYEAYDPIGGTTFGKEKIKASNLQFKISLTL